MNRLARGSAKATYYSPLPSRLVWLVSLLLMALLIYNSQQALAEQVDKYNSPALNNTEAEYDRLLDITQAGNRLIALGLRGQIIYSDDHGSSWQQAQVPVRTTLTALHFPTPELGWAVGHGSVVLHTSDGGNSWYKQLDAQQAAQLMLDDAETKLVLGEHQSLPAQDMEALQLYQEMAEMAVEDGFSRPLLDVFFTDSNNGIVVGAYGHLFTTQDGGQSWQPRQWAIDNPDSLHLNAVSQLDDSLFIAGEYGLLFRSQDQGLSWQTLSSPYEGSFFGLQPHGQSLYVYGLRGNLFRSDNRGSSWQSVELLNQSSLFGSVSSGQQLAFVGANGALLFSAHPDEPLQQRDGLQRQTFSGITLDNQQFIITSADGIQRLALTDDKQALNRGEVD